LKAQNDSIGSHFSWENEEIYATHSLSYMASSCSSGRCQES